MNKILFFLIGFVAFILFSHCRNNNQTKNPGESESLTTKSTNSNVKDPGNDLFLIQTPAGYYKPSGLRPLNLIEIYDRAKNGPNFQNSFPLKDKFGNAAKWDTLLHSEVPLFLQIYANDSNRLVEGVVFEMNDTIQGLIMRVRFAKSGE